MSDVKDCDVHKCTFKEQLYHQQLMQASMERKYVFPYNYGLKLGNNGENTNISIPTNEIQSGIQTVLRWV